MSNFISTLKNSFLLARCTFIIFLYAFVAVYYTSKHVLALYFPKGFHHFFLVKTLALTMMWNWHESIQKLLNKHFWNKLEVCVLIFFHKIFVVVSRSIFEMLGIGCWSKIDTDIQSSMIFFRNLKSRIPYRMKVKRYLCIKKLKLILGKI